MCSWTWCAEHCMFDCLHSVVHLTDHVIYGHYVVWRHSVLYGNCGTLATWLCHHLFVQRHSVICFCDHVVRGHCLVTIHNVVCLRDHNIVRGHCLVSETRPCVFLTHRLSLKETLRFFWAVFLAFTSGEEVSELRFSVIKFFSPLKYQYLSTIGEVFLGKMQENQRVEKGLTAE